MCYYFDDKMEVVGKILYIKLMDAKPQCIRFNKVDGII